MMLICLYFGEKIGTITKRFYLCLHMHTNISPWVDNTRFCIFGPKWAMVCNSVTFITINFVSHKFDPMWKRFSGCWNISFGWVYNWNESKVKYVKNLKTETLSSFLTSATLSPRLQFGNVNNRVLITSIKRITQHVCNFYAEYSFLPLIVKIS